MPSTIDPALTPLVSAPLDGLDFAYDLGDYGSPLISTGVGVTPLVVQGFAGQTADLVRIETSALANLVSVGPTGVIKFGADMDTNLYRSAANVLKTDDDFQAGTLAAMGTDGYLYAARGHANEVTIGQWPGGFAGIGFGSALDTNLYRSAANTLKTDDALTVAGGLTLANDVYHKSLTDSRERLYFANAGATIFRAATHEFRDNDNTTHAQLVTGTGQFRLPITGATAGILIGGDTNLYRSAANSLKTDDHFYMSSTGATEAAPRTFGFSDIGSGTAARLQFGDGNNALQNGFGTNQQLYSFHSLELRGNRRIGGGAGPAFVVGGATQPGTSIINDRDQLGLAVKGFSSQTLDLQQWQTSAGVILTAVDAAGKLLFGPSGAQDTNLYRASANMLQTDDDFTISTATTPSLWIVEGSQKRQMYFDGATLGIYDTVNGKDILKLDADGVHVNPVISRDQIGVRARDDATNSGKQWSFYATTHTGFAFWAGTISADAFQLSTIIADTETSMLVRRNLGGVYSLQRVSVGAADSGGAGYKVLRIPN